MREPWAQIKICFLSRLHSLKIRRQHARTQNRLWLSVTGRGQDAAQERHCFRPGLTRAVQTRKAPFEARAGRVAAAPVCQQRSPAAGEVKLWLTLRLPPACTHQNTTCSSRGCKNNTDFAQLHIDSAGKWRHFRLTGGQMQLWRHTCIKLLLKHLIGLN